MNKRPSEPLQNSDDELMPEYRFDYQKAKPNRFADRQGRITTQNDARFFKNANQDLCRIEILRTSGWLKLLEPSWINLGILSSLLGGIIFLIYFCNIRYFPELDSQSLLFFLAAITPLGIFFVFALVSFLLSPGIIWTFFLNLDTSIYPLLSKHRIMIAKNLLPGRVKTPDENKYFPNNSYELYRENYIFSKSKIGIIYAYAFVAGFLFFNIYALFNIKDTTININFLAKIIDASLKAGDIALVLLYLYTFMFAAMVFVIYKNCFGFGYGFVKKVTFLKSVWISIKLFTYSIGGFVFYFIYWLLISTFFSQSTDGTNNSLPLSELLPIFFATFISCFATSLIVVCRYPKKQISLLLDLGIGCIILLLLTAFLDKMTIIPEKIMNVYGWGNINNASIVVNRIGCQAIESMNIKIGGSCLEKDRTYKIAGVCILSSIGKNYYLRFPRCNLKKGDPMPTELTLERTNIISWSRQNLRKGESIKSK